MSNVDTTSLAKQSSSHKTSWLGTLSAHAKLTEAVTQHPYPGAGAAEDPYIISFLPHNDPQNALTFPKGQKWSIAIFQALSFFAVTFGSSVYASGIHEIVERFHVSMEVATLGLALYVLGFAIGPILWAPMSEVYGRKMTFLVSYTLYVVFTAVAPAAQNIAALLVVRFLAGALGASAQTNPGGAIADMFSKEERGMVMALFAVCPFLGPALGPIVGGFVGQAAGWRWILGVNAILSGVVWVAAMLTIRETYAPVILTSRAQALSQLTGKTYISQLDAHKPRRTLAEELKVALTRPWIFLVLEPIVLLTGLYVSIIYATLYMFFAAIPIVFEETRGWSQGVAGLPFVGVAVGAALALVVAGWDKRVYERLTAAAEAASKTVPPEARLRNAMIGSIILPIGLFLFAWTTYPSIHWIAPVIGATVFSCGLVMVFISLITYVVDTYSVYAVSALAANTILRSFFATAFPLFTDQMYAALGDQWASSIPAFLVVGCLPVPFLFYRYGAHIRSKCKFAAEAAGLMDMMEQQQRAAKNGGSGEWKERG